MDCVKKYCGIPVIAVTVYNLKKSIEEKFPANGNKYLLGQRVVNKRGQEKIVIGHFGSSSDVHKKGLDLGRELYYGDKKTTQVYANSRAKGNEKPVVAVLVADRHPGLGDHVQGPFEYDPLSPKYMQEANLEVYEIEEVNIHTREGFIGSFNRMVDQMRFATFSSVVWSPEHGDYFFLTRNREDINEGSDDKDF